jgi:hypothetical protein
MDRKRAKKIRSARVIMTNIFMALSVVAIVFVLMLIAMGFSFNENGSLEQSGLLQISSRPSGATVEIDGKVQFGHTTINKLLSSGEHHILISKDGYDTWQKDVRIDSGLLTNINWVRLFPLNPVTEKVLTFDEPRLLSFSSNRKNLLYGEQESYNLILVNIQDDELVENKIDITKILGITNHEVARTANLSVMSWNEAGNKIILTWKNDEEVFWYLADLESPENSINLSSKFGYNFSTIRIANESASKLWAVENGNLHLIDLSNLTIHQTKIANIESITNNRDTVVYVGTDATTKIRSISVFREGETGPSVVKDLSGINASTITLSTGTYWGEDWLAFSIDKNINLLGGKYPSFDKPVKNSLKSILKRELGYAPTNISRDNEQHIVVFSNGTNRTAFDFETKDYFDSRTGTSVKANWLDDYILWYKEANKIFIQDFDGNNTREIISEINNNQPICLSENNRWLYYFDVVEKKVKTDSETSTAAPTETTEKAEIKYILTRKALNQ